MSIQTQLECPLKPLLILDVDETLIYTTDPQIEGPPPRVDFHAAGYPVMKRPFVDSFLRWAFSRPVAFWSKGGPDRIKPSLDKLLQPGEKPEFIYTMEKCTKHLLDPDEWENTPNGHFIELKDLKKVPKQFDRNQILALDDGPESWKLSYGNVVPIRPFEGDSADDELLRVMPFLEKWFRDPKGVRHIEKRYWRSQSP